MSVIIKGMDMPRHCGLCPFSGPNYCYAKGEEDIYAPKPCPLIEIPSAEVEPVKHGRLEWRKEKTIWQTGYYCSECQAFFGKDYDMVKYFNYCPNCGARMESEE